MNFWRNLFQFFFLLKLFLNKFVPTYFLLCLNVQVSLTFFFLSLDLLSRLASALQLQRLWRNCCPNLPIMTWRASALGQIVWGLSSLGLLLCTLLILLTPFAITRTQVTFFLILLLSTHPSLVLVLNWVQIARFIHLIPIPYTPHAIFSLNTLHLNYLF